MGHRRKLSVVEPVKQMADVSMSVRVDALWRGQTGDGQTGDGQTGNWKGLIHCQPRLPARTDNRLNAHN